MAFSLQTHYDVVIVGGGHNGLVAAAYLSRAGKRVLVLERRAYLGGAAISEQAFPGVEVRLSAYAYLVSLLPQQIIQDLGLRLETRQRRFASYTPLTDGSDGYLVSNQSTETTRQSFERIAGNSREFDAFHHFYSRTAALAKLLWPTVLAPLPSRAELLQKFDTPELRTMWDHFIERPLGEVIESTFQDDLVRGLVFTDGKIGALTHPHDPTLVQNRTFLYHVIGNGTGEWRVPVGGMGALTASLTDVAGRSGATLLTDAEVQRVHVGTPHEVEFEWQGQAHKVAASFVLVNATPHVLGELVGADHPKPNGSVFKINMVLKRLPRLRAGHIAPEDAFSGTFHFREGYAAMQASYQEAANGEIPAQPPGEMYCHSLTDDTIMGESAKGLYTLTMFGLDMPYNALRGYASLYKKVALERYLDGINSVLAEPIQDCLALDADGKPCIAAKSPLDLEAELAMSGGNIFHTDLQWPFAEKEEEVGTWGVETPYPKVYLCGAGARRGGGVSGIAGHNAARAVLAAEHQ
jgi:phytoene dehydrogenase-like protein